jgi:hypothetical protein
MFSVLPSKFDADFYFKIDDDVAVNVYAMADYLAARRTQGNLYLVCPQACNQKGLEYMKNPRYGRNYQVDFTLILHKVGQEWIRVRSLFPSFTYETED